MKRLLALILLAGCSVGTQQSETALQPLPTTGLSNRTRPTIVIKSDKASIDRFINNFNSTFTDFKWLSNEQILEWGYFWCVAQADGFSLEEIVDQIDTNFNSQEERRIMKYVSISASLDLCPTAE